jgi:hypothetical protein
MGDESANSNPSHLCLSRANIRLAEIKTCIFINILIMIQQIFTKTLKYSILKLIHKIVCTYSNRLELSIHI